MDRQAQRDRAKGALVGVALGDALGMPSQTLSREKIFAAYGRITDFLLPYPDHPVSHGLLAAQITDDTEQTLLLADQLIRRGGQIDAVAWAQALLEWEADVTRRGSRDLLGPSSKAAQDALMAGVPASETGRRGTTNGAAMRIA
ncbi:MAG: ADP-ribosylglycohydrolase family protein, partial [Pseudorhodobacter sp.]|nr:ADP-ribosylglycohydrolase family protein [Pseudorhodobacter sp.]